MKKLFMTGTDEQVELGDVIAVTCEKEIEDGKVTIEKEVKLTELIVPILIEMGIIEEDQEENEDEEELINFSEDFEGFKEAVAEDIEEINEDRIKINKRLLKLEEKVVTIDEILKSLMSWKDNALSKKK